MDISELQVCLREAAVEAGVDELPTSGQLVWDSLTRLCLCIEVESRHGIEIETEALRECETVEDLLKVVNDS